MRENENTGFVDMDCRPIYEGDLVKLSYGIPPTYDILRVVKKDDKWWMRNTRLGGQSDWLSEEYCESITIYG